MPTNGISALMRGAPGAPPRPFWEDMEGRGLAGRLSPDTRRAGSMMTWDFQLQSREKYMFTSHPLCGTFVTAGARHLWAQAARVGPAGRPAGDPRGQGSWLTAPEGRGSLPFPIQKGQGPRRAQAPLLLSPPPATAERWTVAAAPGGWGRGGPGRMGSCSLTHRQALVSSRAFPPQLCSRLPCFGRLLSLRRSDGCPSFRRGGPRPRGSRTGRQLTPLSQTLFSLLYWNPSVISHGPWGLERGRQSLGALQPQLGLHSCLTEPAAARARQRGRLETCALRSACRL